MKLWRNCMWFVVSVMIAITGMVIASPAYAGVTCKNPGSNVPVITVHGLNSSAEVWTKGETPMSAALKKVDNIQVEHFNYENANEWVTNEKIGPELAKKIDCLARASKSGKVIAIGHSMGGLAIQYAARQTVDGRKVADELGFVATLGTPYEGSGFGNLCHIAGFDERCEGSAPTALAKGSRELAALKPFPKNIPVLAIAGRVTLQFNLIFASYEKDLKGDKVVKVDSATGHYTTIGKGDGKQVYKCYGESRFPNGDASCEHGNMLNTPYVQEGVVGGIKAYLASEKEPDVTLPPHEDVDLFGKLTFPHLNQWGSSMGQEDIANFVDNTNCKRENAACPQMYVFDLDTDYNHEQFGDNPLTAAAADYCFAESGGAYGKLKHKATVDVDGEQAEYYEQTLCPPGIQPQTTHYVWYIKSRDVLIVATDTEHGKIEIEDLRAAIANIKWL